MERDPVSQADTLLPKHVAALLHRQEVLQTEAIALLARVDLLRHLGHAGQPVLIGSAALGLMVWRDIDIMVIAPGLGVARTFEVLSPLFADPCVTQLRYLNESGSFNERGRPEDERYYVALHYRVDGEAEWKIDISFWLADLPRREIADMEATRRKLTDETRLAILWIKQMWHRRPSYRTAVLSIDIYDAVLEHGVRTPGAFERYLHERGKPVT